jgi:hypothetical protein
LQTEQELSSTYFSSDTKPHEEQMTDKPIRLTELTSAAG